MDTVAAGGDRAAVSLRRRGAPDATPEREASTELAGSPLAGSPLACSPLAGLAVAPIGPVAVYRSLQVGASDDPAELEAERTADTIVTLLRSASAAPVHVEPSEGAPGRDVVGALRRLATRVGAAGGELDEATGNSIARLRGGGSALPSTVLRTMESAFGTDLSDVRVHTGSTAERLNTAVSATAFTVGSDIVFRSGLPDTSSEPGQRLLAHELTHVLQQRGAPVLSALRSMSARSAGTPVRRMLVEANGEPSDVPNLLLAYPEQAAEIRAHQDVEQRYYPSAAAADAPLTFEPVAAVPGVPLLEQSGASGSGLSSAEREADNAGPQLGPLQAAPVDESPAFKKFKKAFYIDNAGVSPKASTYLDLVGAPKELVPNPAVGEPSGNVAFVANVLTIPKGDNVQRIIDAYATEGMSPEQHASFAMVIGVNRFQSLDGRSADLVRQACDSAVEAPFPCTVVPFLWNFNWSRPFQEVAEAFGHLDPQVRKEVLAYERKQLVQSTIPYGALRELVTSHPATRRYVADLRRRRHQAVYVHLGDDDAVSLRTRAGKLMDGYAGKLTGAVANDKAPPLVIGGYDLRLRDDPLGGDLEPGDPGHVMSSLASRVDTWFRSALASVFSDAVYPTEPNLAFLAATGSNGPTQLDALITLDEETSRKLGTEAVRNYGGPVLSTGGELLGPKPKPVKAPKPVKPVKGKAAAASSMAAAPALDEKPLAEEGSVRQVYSTGQLYGRNANEGDKLRTRIGKISAGSDQAVKPGQSKPEPKGKASSASSGSGPAALTVYEPDLAIATASTRFTMSDDDRRQHDPDEKRYAVKREDAVRLKGPAGLRTQLVEDILTIKQSHVGGLAKELTKLIPDKPTREQCAIDVKAYVAAMLLGTQLSGGCSSHAALIIAELTKTADMLQPIKTDLQALFDSLEGPPSALPGAGVGSSVADLGSSAADLGTGAAVGRDAEQLVGASAQ